MEDFDNLDLSRCRERILDLQSERERLKEQTERLENKVKAYNNELASRKDELQRASAELDEERRKNKDRASVFAPQKDDIESREAQIRCIMEEELRKRVPKTTNHALMVGHDASQRDINAVDTVLVTFTPAGTEHRYTLSCRVDGMTTVKMLRNDCCNFWNVSDVVYTLRLGASKVHESMLISECFKPSESAMLSLVEKDTRATRVADSVSVEVMPKVGPQAQAQMATTKSASSPDNKAFALSALSGGGESFAEELKHFPGLARFLTAKDQRITDHVGFIKLRDIFAYILLIFATMFAYSIRSKSDGGVTFALHRGSKLTFAPEAGSGRKYSEIQTWDHAYEWLEHIADPLWADQPTFYRYFNYPIGFISLRQQRVKPASIANCERKESPAACLAPYVTEATIAKDPLNIVLSNPGPGRVLNPNTFRPAQSDVGSTSGVVDTYSSAGYTVQYTLDNFYSNGTTIQDVKSTYLADIASLKAGKWFDISTRVLFVSFVVYNSNYDYWVWNSYSLESAANGRIYPLASARPFRPNSWETDEEYQSFYFDMGRLVIILYLLIFRSRAEVQYLAELRAKEYDTCVRRWARYLFSFGGVIDVAIVIVYLIILLQRYALFSTEPTSEVVEFAASGFEDFSFKSSVFINISMAEGILVVLCNLRLLSLFTIYRAVFVTFHAFLITLKRFAYFGIIFVPIFLGYVFAAHSTWGGRVYKFATIHRSMITVIEFLHGDWNSHDMEIMDSQFISTLITCIFFFMGTLLVNMFIAILVDSYQQVRISHGGMSKNNKYCWTWSQRLQWALWPFLFEWYCKVESFLSKRRDEKRLIKEEFRREKEAAEAAEKEVEELRAQKAAKRSTRRQRQKGGAEEEKLASSPKRTTVNENEANKT